MTIRATQAADQTQAPPRPPRADAPPPAEDPTQAIVDKIVTSQAFGEAMMGRLNKGGEVTVEVGDKEVIRIKSNTPSALERFATGTKAVVGVTATELSGVVKADPAFAFKETALGVKTQVYNGLPKDIQTAADIGFLPMLRVVTLALDFKKFMDTRKNPESTRMDKIVDGGHLVTDAAGLAGAVAFSVPAIGALAVPLTIVGLTGDVAAFSYHVLDYVKERGAEYAAAKREKEEPAPVPPTPPQTPAPTP